MKYNPYLRYACRTAKELQRAARTGRIYGAVETESFRITPLQVTNIRRANTPEHGHGTLVADIISFDCYGIGATPFQINPHSTTKVGGTLTRKVPLRDYGITGVRTGKLPPMLIFRNPDHMMAWRSVEMELLRRRLQGTIEDIVEHDPVSIIGMSAAINARTLIPGLDGDCDSAEFDDSPCGWDEEEEGDEDYDI